MDSALGGETIVPPIGRGAAIDNPEESQKSRRIARACEQCRKKKIKCDGNRLCANCVAYKTDCIYTDPPKKRQAPRRAGYVAKLEDKLEKLEKLLGQDKFMSDDFTENDGTAPSLLACGHIAGPAGSQCEYCHPVSSIPVNTTTTEEEVTRKLGYLFLQTNGEVEYVGAAGPGTMIDDSYPQVRELIGDNSFEQLNDQAHRAYALNLGKSSASVFAVLQNARLEPGMTIPVLPTREVCARYIEAYFTQVHHVFPLLDKQEFFRKAEQIHGVSSEDDASFTTIHLLVLAFGAHIVHAEDVGRATSKGYQFFTGALTMMYKVGYTLSLSAVHAMMLLALYLENSEHTHTLWLVLGNTIRVAQTLGVHRDFRVVQGLDPASAASGKMQSDHLELRRRTYWMLYVMDNNLASSTGKPAALQDFDSDQTLPVSSNDALQDSIALKFADGSPFNYLYAQIQLARIAHQVQQRLYSTRAISTPPEEIGPSLADVDQKLLNWLANLPDEFHPDKARGTDAYGTELPSIYHTHLIPLLQLHYQYLMIMIHRRNLQTWPGMAKGRSVRRVDRYSRLHADASQAIAVQAARSILSIIGSSPPRSEDACVQLKYTYPPMAMFLLFSNLVRNPGSPSAADDLEIFKGLISFQTPKEFTGSGNAELVREFFIEMLRIAELAIASSHEQGIKRPRDAAYEQSYPAYSEGPASTYNSSTTSGSYASSVLNMQSATNLQVPQGGLWTPPSRAYAPRAHDSEENTYTAAVLPMHDSRPQTSHTLYEDSSYMALAMADPTSAEQPTGPPAPGGSYNSTFDEAIWQASALPENYNHGQ